MTFLSRRAVLSGMLALPFAVGEDAVYVAVVNGREARLSNALMDSLASESSAAILGRHYWKTIEISFGHELDYAQQLLGSPAAQSHCLSASRESRRRTLRHLVSGDYRDGRTLRVDGWVLSRSEVLLFAIAARVMGAQDA